MSRINKVVDDFLSLLEYMRENYFRPAEQMARSRLSPGQFHAIAMLKRKGPLSMSELAGEMKVSKQQLTPLINKMIDSGLVARKAGENDRRVIRIEITECGRSTIETLFSEMRLTFTKKIQVLPEIELAEMEQMLKRIMEILRGVN